MSHQNTVFHQLLKPILRQDFERLSKQYHQGQKLRSATRWDQFIAIFMSQFSCRQSLRDIESNLESQQEKLYHLGAKRIARSTLQESMKSNLPAYINNCLPNYFNIVKIPRLLINFGLRIHYIHSMQGRTLKFPSSSIVVFDKGYIDYQWFAEMTHQNISFVTRLRPKTVYEVKSSHKVLACKDILADEYIELSSEHAKKRGAPKLLRRIEFYDVQKRRTFEFLSNNFHLAASTIAAIYKDRWKVELFFKAIKQNLKLKSFLGRSRNAIQTQIWIALIAYLLVSFAKHMAQEGWSVQRLLRIIQVNLFERKLLKSLFLPDKKWLKQEEPQLKFFL